MQLLTCFSFDRASVLLIVVSLFYIYVMIDLLKSFYFWQFYYNKIFFKVY